MKNFKKSVITLMVAVICLCSVSASYAFTQAEKEKAVGMVTAFAKAIMQVRQESEKPGHDYDSVMKMAIFDNQNLDNDYQKVFTMIINDAYYNHEEKISPMEKKKEVNKFTMEWYYKVCAIVGMNPE